MGYASFFSKKPDDFSLPASLRLGRPACFPLSIPGGSQPQMPLHPASNIPCFLFPRLFWASILIFSRFRFIILKVCNKFHVFFRYNGKAKFTIKDG